jgi:transcriptional regulator with XRE-family HTH domain
VNEPLRRALLRARLREGDIAARLGVDPKTVRRWLNGRVPYPHNRAAIAELVGADEADLWPDAGGPLAARNRPEELGTVYPHRWAVPREAWTRLFGSAERDMRSWPTARCSSPRMRESSGSLPKKGGRVSPSGSRSETPTGRRLRYVAMRKASAMPWPPRSATR